MTICPPYDRRPVVKVIGLCGGSGSGKGVLAEILSRAGFLHIDADAVYHRITAQEGPCLREMAEAFGESIISSDGSLDRGVLAEIVFAEGGKERLAQLNSISHRHVLSKIRETIEREDGNYIAALVDAPLLFESGFDAECDVIVSVIAPKGVRIARICERDGISHDAAERRIGAQLDDEFLRLHSDIIINNDKDIASLEEQAIELISKLKEN